MSDSLFANIVEEEMRREEQKKTRRGFKAAEDTFTDKDGAQTVCSFSPTAKVRSAL